MFDAWLHHHEHITVSLGYLNCGFVLLQLLLDRRGVYVIESGHQSLDAV